MSGNGFKCTTIAEKTIICQTQLNIQKICALFLTPSLPFQVLSYVVSDSLLNLPLLTFLLSQPAASAMLSPHQLCDVTILSHYGGLCVVQERREGKSRGRKKNCGL